MNGSPGLVACHDCDLLQRGTRVPRGGVMVCGQCKAVLYRNNPDSIERTLALTMAALILLVISNVFPIVGIESQGGRNASTLWGAVHTLWSDHMVFVAGLVFTTTMLLPALKLVLMAFLLALRPSPTILLRLMLIIRPWSMVEVFVLGLLVAVQKLSHFATVIPGVGLWSFGALMVILACLTATFNVHELWRTEPLEQAHVDW